MTSNNEDESDREEAGDEEQEDEEIEKEELPEPEEDEKQESNDSSETKQLDSLSFKIDVSNISRILDNIQVIQDPIPPETRRAIHRSNLEAISEIRESINPHLVGILQQAAIDPEVLQQFQEPLIDPEDLYQITELPEIKQPTFDPEILEIFESLNETQFPELYKTVAVFEQIERESVETADEGSVDELESDNFIYLFYNSFAFYLLQQSRDLPEEAVANLQNLAQSKNIQDKKEAFIRVVNSLKDTAVVLLLNGMRFSLGVALSLHSDELMRMAGPAEGTDQSSTDGGDDDGDDGDDDDDDDDNDDNGDDDDNDEENGVE